ncbi:HD-GYP domain-containing protein [Neorhizobium sp. DAR64861/K0K2]|uniref:HD-GYP domain-containing protein n=1 Tax=unclassified Neorhizobium TaxID=2629175 RepID=UPI003D28DF43
MRKRIRLHQVRLGMYVEELEGTEPLPSHFIGPIASPADIDRMINSHAISVVIDTRKGLDVNGASSGGGTFDPVEFDAALKMNYSAEHLTLARKAIQETKPYVRGVLAAAHGSGIFEFDAARRAVDRIMSEPLTNASAMIAVAKLKEKDEGTFLHSLSVSALMITFGRALGLDVQGIRLLGLGGLVHDLGKMLLPTELLRKPGKLTAEDIAVIQTHPELGYELVKQIDGMPKAVLDICLYHHEKFDGSGYPFRKAGSHIPQVARIAALCDVYDALTTVRPYKRAWSQAEAIDTMLRSKGHFDPELMKTFLSKMVINGTLH